LVGRRRGVPGSHRGAQFAGLRRVLHQKDRFQPRRVGGDDRDAVQPGVVHGPVGKAGDGRGHLVAPGQAATVVDQQEVDVGVDDEDQIDANGHAGGRRFGDGHAVLAQQQARGVAHPRAARAGGQHAHAHGREAGGVHGGNAHTQLLARHLLRRDARRQEKGQSQDDEEWANACLSADHLFPFCPPSGIIST